MNWSLGQICVPSLVAMLQNLQTQITVGSEIPLPAPAVQPAAPAKSKPKIPLPEKFEGNPCKFGGFKN